VENFNLINISCGRKSKSVIKALVCVFVWHGFHRDYAEPGCFEVMCFVILGLNPE